MNGLFPGFVLLSLAAVGIGTARCKKASGSSSRPVASSVRTVATYAVVGVVGFVLSLGPRLFFNGKVLMNSGPYDWLLDIVPGLDGLRVPLRLAIIVYLSLTVLAAFGVRWLIGRLSRAGAVAFCIVAVCGLVVEGYFRLPVVAFDTFEAERRISFEIHPETRGAYPVEERRAVRRFLNGRSPGAVLELPFWGQSRGSQDVQTVRYMHGILEHGRPLVNGHSGYHTSYMRRLSGDLLRYDAYGSLLEELRGIDVRFVLVHLDDFASTDHAQATLDAISRQQDQIASVHRFGMTYIVELKRADHRS